MAQEIELESLDSKDLPLNREFRIRMSLKGGEKKYQFINSFYDRYFLLARIEMPSRGSPSGDVIALLKLQEVWAEHSNETWARRFELQNTSKQPVSFALVIRILDYP